MHLRQYQTDFLEKILQEWKTCDSVLGQLPTAAGKTIVSVKLIQDIQKSLPDAQIFFTCHRIELVQQTSEVFTTAGIKHSFVSSEFPYDFNAKVFLCTHQTLARKLQYVINPALLIIDEAHLSTGNTVTSIINYFKSKKSKVLGITATPKGALHTLYNQLILGPSIKELISQGYLSKPDIYVPAKTAQLVEAVENDWRMSGGDYKPKAIDKWFSDNSKLIYGDTIEHCKRLNPDNKPAAVFCINIKHVHETAGILNAAGFKAAGIDGTMSKDARQELLNKFYTGEITYMVSCQLLLEGVDFPACYMAVWLRPTKSIVVWLQGNGRLMRIADSKDKCIILDQVNNTAALGPSFIDRYWDLYGKQKSKTQIAGINFKLCTRCGNYIKNSLIVCLHCGKVTKSKYKAFKVIYEELQKITIESAQRLIESECARILKKEKNRMQARTKEYYLEKFVEWNKKGDPEVWAESMVVQDRADFETFKTGDFEALIVMYSKQKRFRGNPSGAIAHAKKVLKEREEYLAKRKANASVSVFETGTDEELREHIETVINPKRLASGQEPINNIDAYIGGIKRKRLQSVIDNGTPEQVAEAKKLAFGDKDLFTQRLEFALSGKMTNEDGSPKVFTQEEAEKFARNCVHKALKGELESGDPVRVRSAVEQMHVKNVDAYVETVLEGAAV